MQSEHILNSSSSEIESKKEKKCVSVPTYISQTHSLLMEYTLLFYLHNHLLRWHFGESFHNDGDSDHSLYNVILQLWFQGDKNFFFYSEQAVKSLSSINKRPLSADKTKILHFLNHLIQNKNKLTEVPHRYIPYVQEPYLSCVKFKIKNNSLNLNGTDFHNFFSAIQQFSFTKSLSNLVLPTLLKGLINDFYKKDFLINSPEMKKNNSDQILYILQSIFKLTHHQNNFIPLILQLIEAIYQVLGSEEFIDLMETLHSSTKNFPCCVQKEIERSILLYTFKSKDKNLKEHFILHESYSFIWGESLFKEHIPSFYKEFISENKNFLNGYIDQLIENKNHINFSSLIFKKLTHAVFLFVELFKINYKNNKFIATDFKIDNSIPILIGAKINSKKNLIVVNFIRSNSIRRIIEDNLSYAVKVLKISCEIQLNLAIALLNRLLSENIFSGCYELLLSGIINITKKNDETKNFYLKLIDKIVNHNIPKLEIYYLNQILFMFFQAGYDIFYKSYINIRFDLPTFKKEEKHYNLYLSFFQILHNQKGINSYLYNNFFNSEKKIKNFWNNQFWPLLSTPLTTFLLSINNSESTNELKNLKPLNKSSMIDWELKDIFSQTQKDFILNFNSTNLVEIFSEIFKLNFDTLKYDFLQCLNMETILFRYNTEVTQSSLIKQLSLFINNLQISENLFLFYCSPKNFDELKNLLEIKKTENSSSYSITNLLIKIKKLLYITKYIMPMHFFIEQSSFSQLLKKLHNENIDVNLPFNLTQSLLSFLSNFMQEFHSFLESKHGYLSDFPELKNIFQDHNIHKIVASINNIKSSLSNNWREMVHFSKKNKINSKGDIEKIECLCPDCKSAALKSTILNSMTHSWMFFNKLNFLINNTVKKMFADQRFAHRVILLLEDSSKLDDDTYNLPLNFFNENAYDRLKKYSAHSDLYLSKLEYLHEYPSKINDDYEKIISNKNKKVINIKKTNLKCIKIFKFWHKIISNYSKFEKLIAFPPYVTNASILISTNLLKLVNTFNQKLKKGDTVMELRVIVNSIINYIPNLSDLLIQYKNILTNYVQLKNKLNSEGRIIYHFEKKLSTYPNSNYLKQFNEKLEMDINNFKKKFHSLDLTHFAINSTNIDKLNKLKEEIQNIIYWANYYIDILQKKIAVFEEYQLELSRLGKSNSQFTDAPIPSQSHVVEYKNQNSPIDRFNIEKKSSRKKISLITPVTEPKKTGTTHFFKGLGYSFPLDDDKYKFSIKCEPNFSPQNTFYPSSFSLTNQLTLSPYFNKALHQNFFLKYKNSFQNLFSQFLRVNVNDDDIEKLFALRCCYFYSITLVANFFKKFSLENSCSFYRKLSDWFNLLRNSIFHHQILNEYNGLNNSEINIKNFKTENVLLRDALINIIRIFNKLQLDDKKSAEELFEEAIKKNKLLSYLQKPHELEKFNKLDQKIFEMNGKSEPISEKIARVTATLQRHIQQTISKNHHSEDGFIFKYALDFHVNQFHLFCNKFGYAIPLKNSDILESISMKLRLESNCYRHQIIPQAPGKIANLFLTLVNSTNSMTKNNFCNFRT